MSVRSIALSGVASIVAPPAAALPLDLPPVSGGSIVAPDAPTLGTPVPGNGQLSIPFTDGSSGGSPITSHKIYEGPSAGSLTLLGTISTSTPFVDTGLTNGTARYYAMSAVNSVGEGALSAVVSGTPNATLPIFKAAIAAVKAGTRRAKVVAVGSSETAGVHAGASGSTSADGDGFQYAWPRIFGNKLIAAGVPAQSNASFGDQGYAAYGAASAAGGYLAHNLQFVHSDFATDNTTSPIMSGWGLQTNTSGAYVGFRPYENVTDFDVYVLDGNTSTIGIQVDSGTEADYTTTSTVGIKKYSSASVAKGAHNLFVASRSAFFVRMLGFIGYDKTTAAVDIINAGWNGGAVANWNRTTGGVPAVAYRNLLLSLSPDLVIVETGVNDSINGTALSTYQSTLQDLISTIKGSGADVWIVTSPPYSGGATYNGSPLPSDAVRKTYDDATKAVASASGVGVTDLVAYFGSWASMNAASLTYDVVHPNQAGYAQMGQKIYADIAAAIA